MANQEHVDILGQGAEVWNEWRAKNRSTRPDLSDTDLNIVGLTVPDSKLRDAVIRGEKVMLYTHHSGVYQTGLDLSEANLTNASLTSVDLFAVYLNFADLRNADLSDSDLTYADLACASLIRANLSGVNLSHANLNHTNLGHADLSETNFSTAITFFTALGDVDLSEAIGLEAVNHTGPSTIGLDTISKSKGGIPKVFLRGCGVSDLDIEHAKLYQSDLSMEQVTDIAYRIAELRGDSALHFHSCFISHATPDKIFAQKLFDDLQDSGVRCWFAPEDMKIGDEIRPTIDQAILVHDKLLLVLSENSIKSRWVQDEVEAAYERENQEDRPVLFPVRLDATVMDTDRAWAAKIRRQRHVGDFSDWKDHDAYQQAFDRLMRDLQASEQKT